MNHRQETRGADFETSKPKPSDELLPERPHPLHLPKQRNHLGTKYSNTTQAEHGREGRVWRTPILKDQGEASAQRSEVGGEAGKGIGKEPVWCQKPGHQSQSGQIDPIGTWEASLRKLWRR